jgi:hypothetical protein
MERARSNAEPVDLHLIHSLRVHASLRGGSSPPLEQGGGSRWDSPDPRASSLICAPTGEPPGRAESYAMRALEHPAPKGGVAQTALGPSRVT